LAQGNWQQAMEGSSPILFGSIVAQTGWVSKVVEDDGRKQTLRGECAEGVAVVGRISAALRATGRGWRTVG